MNKSTKTAAAAGTWPSPISAESLASANIRLAQPCADGDFIYWLEGRPTEEGRTVLVACDSEGNKQDLTPAPYDVRSKVHEYGGGAFHVKDGNIWFVNASDQGIYQIEGNSISCVFQRDGSRFANCVFDGKQNRLIAIVEQHGTNEEPQNFLGCIDLNTNELSIVHQGADFYSSPTLSADGTRIAFLTWSHPHMPWDETTLHIADLTEQHELVDAQIVSEGHANFSPQFGPDDRLFYVSDANEWWNLFVRDNEGVSKQLTHVNGELGMPHWIFCMSTYGFINPTTAIATYTSNGLWQLCSIDLETGDHKDLTPWSLTAMEHLSVNTDAIVCHAASPDCVDSIVRIQIDTGVSTKTLQKASDLELDREMTSRAVPVTFGEPDAVAYGFHYAPTHATVQLPDGEKPPLIVLVHGGPTTATGSGLNPRIQFWTSRGFAVLDVNYRGSTGFGRTYRHSLRGKWGLYDVEDCINGAQHLIDKGDAHPDQIYIMGGSAGGYTVLSGLTFTDFFAGGISLYGIGDLALLVQDTHKFEARYLDSLVGTYDESLYRQRSPLFFAEKMSAPVMFFQGTEDKMVPPNQAETMVSALKDNGVPVGYELLEGEGHGFRRAESIVKVIKLSLAFFLTIMGQQPSPDSRLSLYNADKLAD